VYDVQLCQTSPLVPGNSADYEMHGDMAEIILMKCCVNVGGVTLLHQFVCLCHSTERSCDNQLMMMVNVVLPVFMIIAIDYANLFVKMSLLASNEHGQPKNSSSR